MILVARFFGRFHYAESAEEMREVVERFLSGFPAETVQAPGFELDCETASFGFMESAPGEGASVQWPDNSLEVTVNFSNGHGGLVWYVDANRASEINEKTQSDMADWAWVSDNPEPVAFGPEILIDVHVPYYHDSRNALPVSRIRAALQEFCRAGSGARPESVHWVKGQPTGERDEG
ncbi:Imm1 family immunity protein [Streptomyces mauvecolor]|uniref:Imm1 family immunity protein n=1 Tax=Streptomyces mauvecolor TaxID=58345 RepID=A0ABV9UWE8_9ACTN